MESGVHTAEVQRYVQSENALTPASRRDASAAVASRCG